ncbi:MAG TPA: hypothetical protein H9689_00700 [Firmicutes bacterium]|nr:hypothetical protein [Bacillota bacterium]
MVEKTAFFEKKADEYDEQYRESDIDAEDEIFQTARPQNDKYNMILTHGRQKVKPNGRLKNRQHVLKYKIW